LSSYYLSTLGIYLCFYLAYFVLFSLIVRTVYLNLAHFISLLSLLCFILTLRTTYINLALRTTYINLAHFINLTLLFSLILRTIYINFAHFIYFNLVSDIFLCFCLFVIKFKYIISFLLLLLYHLSFFSILYFYLVYFWTLFFYWFYFNFIIFFYNSNSWLCILKCTSDPLIEQIISLNIMTNILTCFYFYVTNSLLLIPCFSTIRFFVFSFDVIHSLGIYAFGIKIDAIPGRFNFASTIRTLNKGFNKGFCFELCGTGHSSMLINFSTR